MDILFVQTNDKSIRGYLNNHLDRNIFKPSQFSYCKIPIKTNFLRRIINKGDTVSNQEHSDNICDAISKCTGYNKIIILCTTGIIKTIAKKLKENNLRKTIILTESFFPKHPDNIIIETAIKAIPLFEHGVFIFSRKEIVTNNTY